MSDGPAMLNAILAHPADDTPRLIYADWLEENGQGDRAEFVRVQCEIAGLAARAGHPCGGVADSCHCEPCRSARVHRGRERELFRQSPETRGWLGPALDLVPAGADWWPLLGWFRRGFVSDVRLPLAAFTPDFARALFAAHPVERVAVSDATIWPSGGNDTYYLGDLGRFPQRYWRRLEGLPSRSAVAKEVSAVCVDWGRSLAGLVPTPALS